MEYEEYDIRVLLQRSVLVRNFPVLKGVKRVETNFQFIHTIMMFNFHLEFSIQEILIFLINAKIVQIYNFKICCNKSRGKPCCEKAEM